MNEILRLLDARKFAADFSVELNRSVAWWLERWTSGSGAADPE